MDVQVIRRPACKIKTGETIPGSHAIGNCSVSVTGVTYPASDATLGPAMVFGYVAGTAAVQGVGKAIILSERISTASESASMGQTG